MGPSVEIIILFKTMTDDDTSNANLDVYLQYARHTMDQKYCIIYGLTFIDVPIHLPGKYDLWEFLNSL